MIDFFIMSVEGSRDEYIAEILKAIPISTVVKDRDSNARDNFDRILNINSTKRYKLILQDDVIISKSFHTQLLKAIAEQNPLIASGYSNRAEDLKYIEKGYYYQQPSKFIGAQCLLIQNELCKQLSIYAPEWYNENKQHKTSFDLMIRGFMIKNKIKPLIIVPSIVQHIDGESLMNHKCGKRQSRTFIE